MSTPIQTRDINEDKMNAFLGKVGDFGASRGSSLAYLGQKLGLYKGIAEAGSVTPTELAQQTNTNEDMSENGSLIRQQAVTLSTMPQLESTAYRPSRLLH